MTKLVSRTWKWSLPKTPEELWPVLSDTARFNEASKLPKYQVEETPQADGSVRRIGRSQVMGGTWMWEETPYEWVYRKQFSQTRPFLKGPFESFRIALDLEPAPGGSTATYTVEFRPHGVIGWLLAHGGFINSLGPKIERMVRDACAFLDGARDMPFDYTPPALPNGAVERANALAAKIEQSPNGHGLAQRLATHILTAQEVDLIRIKPLVLARQWQAEPRHVVELCLESARQGLLNLQWGLLCPRCRGAKSMVSALDQLPRGAHCPSCNINYDSEFSRNVEITFQPSPAVREITAGEFCMAGPYATPHVMVQQILGPGEERHIGQSLPAGDYRFRTIDPGATADVAYDGRALPEVIGADGGASSGVAAPPGEVVLRNRAARARTLVVESRAWATDALTAHKVTSLQAFRDLFAEEALRPDEAMSIDNVTLLFTDLEGSTALYQRIGDGPAYHLVREHFGFLTDLVRRHNGAMVKTMGDAVMAAFADPAEAVRAALAMQQRVAGFNARQGSEALVIRMGLHGGPCIAVTLNDRLDYFGSTVNLAARMQGQSGGGEIVISESLAADPAVAELLSTRQMVRESSPLKGFETPIPYRRLGKDGILSSAA